MKLLQQQIFFTGKEVFLMGDFAQMMFIPVAFIVLIFIAIITKKRGMEKIVFLESNDKLEDLNPRDFFYNILKMEKGSKLIYWTEIILLIVDTVYILVGGYFQYLEEMKFLKEFPDFPISPVSSVFLKFSIPIFMWFVLVFLLVFAYFMQKKENKRITEMLDNLDNHNLLTYAREDFFKSDRIVDTGIMAQSDLKLGDEYLFCIYPAYIIPYSWISNIKVDEVFNRGGNYYSLTFTINNFSNFIQIFFIKKSVAEKVRELILKNKHELYGRDDLKW
jgi:hypothetical protein